MDKFYGINRAEITAVNHAGGIETDGIPVVSRKDFQSGGMMGDKRRFWAKNGQAADFSGKYSADFTDFSNDSAFSEGFSESFSESCSDGFSEGVWQDYDRRCKAKAAKTETGKAANNGKGAGNHNSGKAGVKAGAKAGSGVFTALRYGLCAALLLVCALGKFWVGSPLKEASGFIKDQLDRDIIRELSDDAASE